MFNKQKLKLTLLNTGVFIVLFAIFSTIVYFYTKFNLYKGVDRTILMSKEVIQNRLPQISTNLSKDKTKIIVPLEPRTVPGTAPHAIPALDPRIIPILRDEKGNILFETQLSSFLKNNLENIKPVKIDQLYDIHFNEFHFRTIAFSAEINKKTIMVQLLRNTNSEKELLDNLLKIMIAGGVIISLISIGAGVFLAQRTMIPIVNAWKKQRQFVEDASHELRSPLTVVQSQIELILKSPNSTVISNANYLGTALSEIRRLSKLVADLLTLARSDSDMLEIEKKPVDLSALIKNIVEPYTEIAALEDKVLGLKLTEGLVANCDESRISQLIVILLDNALKYTNEGEKVEVSIDRETNKCFISVIDNGIGIKEEEKELIFQRFYRGDRSRTRKTGGTGLGLSIAKWIVEKHGGSIKASPNHPKGTIINVTLPMN